MRGELQRYSTSTLTIAPWRNAAAMPMNTIQIRLNRIKISDHSAGCSSTNRVMIWNMPKVEATTSMTQAIAMARPVVRRSSDRNRAFKG